MSEEEKGKWNLSGWFADADSSSKQEDKETADGIGKKSNGKLKGDEETEIRKGWISKCCKSGQIYAQPLAAFDIKKERAGKSGAGYASTPAKATANEHHVSFGFTEGDK